MVITHKKKKKKKSWQNRSCWKRNSQTILSIFIITFSCQLKKSYHMQMLQVIQSHKKTMITFHAYDIKMYCSHVHRLQLEKPGSFWISVYFLSSIINNIKNPFWRCICIAGLLSGIPESVVSKRRRLITKLEVWCLQFHNTTLLQFKLWF